MVIVYLFASMRSFVFSCCVALGISEWPVPFVVGPDTIPNVELSLDAPSNPLPDVSNAISKLDAERETNSEIQKDKMVRAFNAEIANARVRIAGVIGAAEHQLAGQLHASQHNSAQASVHAGKPTAAFFKSNVVRIVVAPEKHSPESARGTIAEIEGARVADEDAWFEAAVAEMSRLTDVVVATLESEINSMMKASPLPTALSTPANFLQLGEGVRDHGQGGAVAANVRVVGADAPYPTIQSLVDSFQARRDIGEELGKAQALSMYIKLLEFENMLVDSGLNAWVMKSKFAK